MRKCVILLLLFMFLTAACKNPDDQENQNVGASDSAAANKTDQAGDKRNGEVVARVNGKPIYEDELKGSSLEKAIEEEILYQKGIEQGIDEELKDQIEQYRRNLVVRQLRSRIIDQMAEVSDRETREYYDNNRVDYASFLFKELIIKDRELAQDAYERAVSGENFDDLTEEYRQNVKAHAHSHTKVDPPYSNSFADKEEGAVEMFEHPEGYKIAKLTEKHEIPFSTVRKNIKAKLKSRSGSGNILQYIQELKKQSNIEVVKKEVKKEEKEHSHTSMNHQDHSMKKSGFSKEQFLKDAAECLEIPHSFRRTQCFQPYFNYVTHKKSAYYTLQLARSLEDDGVIRDCHMVAHHTGMSVLVKNEFDVEKAFNECTPDCIQGCYHAVLENYVSHAGWQPEEIAEKSTALCNKISGGDKLKNRQCIHGVGHGMLNNQYLPMNAAIGICRQLTGPLRVNSCLGGVFMEHANREILPRDEKELVGVLPEICNQDFDDEILTEKCARAVGEGVMFYTGHDLDKSTELCKHLNKIEYGPCIEAATEMHNASE